MLMQYSSTDSQNAGSDYGSDVSSIDREDTLQRHMKKIQLQDWDKGNTITFNIQLINATHFEQMLGIRTKTPITMTNYKAARIPISRDVYNELKITTENTMGEKQGETAGFDAVALSKANKRVPEIEIEKDTTSVMPVFFLNEELIARVKADMTEFQVDTVAEGSTFAERHQHEAERKDSALDTSTLIGSFPDI